MTIYGLHLAFKDSTDKISSESAPQFTEAQVNRYLNIGLERFVKQRFDGTNPKRTAFEQTQKRTDDLHPLVSKATIPSTGAGFISTRHTATKLYPLPADYWFSIEEGVLFSVRKCPVTYAVDACDGEQTPMAEYENQYFGVYDRRHGEINEILEDPYHRPNKTETIRNLENGNIQLFYDRKYTEPGDLKLVYLKQPQWLTAGSYNKVEGSPLNWKTLEWWMPNQTHREIVNIAALAALEATENPRQQTFAGEVATQE